MADAGREIHVQAGTLQLAARVWGPEEGEPVLALHGWLDNAASFDLLAPLLGGRRIVALDFAGHGHSEHQPPGPWYHFVDYVADALGAADALGWERFSLLGHSLGGAVATLVAGSCPERIERLALIEAIGPLTEPAERAPERLAEALQGAQRARTRPPPVYPDLDRIVAARRAAGDLSYAAARRLVERSTQVTAEGIRWRSDSRLRLPSPLRTTESQALAFLRAIEAPTLLIRGDDGLLPEGDPGIAKRVASLNDARTCTLAGNHHLHLEDPEPVAAVLEDFLPRA